jgi:tetratricopeptide (TPR) repeat protein
LRVGFLFRFAETIKVMNTNNEKDFVPYEQALALKELGFDESTYTWRQHGNGISGDVEGKRDYYNRKGDVYTALPLYQQAFRWFREKYNLREQYGVFPHHTIMINYLIEGGREEEAELECLKKLIEIVKQQTHATTN